MVVFVWSGLTSRLCTIADAIKLFHCSEGGGRELIILWPVDSDCGIEAEKVFDMDYYKNLRFICFKSSHKNFKVIDVKRSMKRSITALIYNIYALCYNMIFDNKMRLVKRYSKGSIKFDFNPPQGAGWEDEVHNNHIRYVEKEIERAVRLNSSIYIRAYCGIIRNDSYNRDLGVLRFSEVYWRKVDKIFSGYMKEQLIGIHIRRTDHKTCIKKSPIEAFIKIMDEKIKVKPETVFFLATDDENVQQELIEKFQTKILIQKKNWGRDTEDGMRSAIIDCLCLSKCQSIIGSYRSVFSKFAADYGKIELTIAK